MLSLSRKWLGILDTQRVIDCLRYDHDTAVLGGYDRASSLLTQNRLYTSLDG